MHVRTSIRFVLAFFLQTIQTVFSGEKSSVFSTDSKGNAFPNIRFAAPLYDFGTINVGEKVNHTFIFTNNGSTALEIASLNLSCNCTTADYSGRVDPGKTGTVSLSINSSNLLGEISDLITVVWKEKSQPTDTLQIKGIVRRQIELQPSTLLLTVVTNSSLNASGTINILNNQEEPLTLSEPECDNRYFAAELKTLRPGKEFILTIRTVPEYKSFNMCGKIRIKTSMARIPEISTAVFAVTAPLVSVMPNLLTLDSPSTDPKTETISIQYNGVGTLDLYDPSINANNVKIRIDSPNPGRNFVAVITFPPGFGLPTNKNIVFSIKSSKPEFPTINVPIGQLSPRSN